jgi:prenyltransferase beta subunit
LTAKSRSFNHIFLLSLFLLLLIGGSFLGIPQNSAPQPNATSEIKSSGLSPTRPYSASTSDPFFDTHQPLPPNGEQGFPSFGDVLVVSGDYVNEAGQESLTPWITLLTEFGFNVSGIHINALTNASAFDVLVVTPSVGTSGIGFGVSLSDAQLIGNTAQPVLLLGYAHEVLDQLAGFDPVTDFIPCLERYLWTDEPALQIFDLPHQIPASIGRYPLYNDHINYEAYRLNSLPLNTEILGTNHDRSGGQLLWYRMFLQNPHIYYWGLDQVAHLTDDGQSFFENLLFWLLRPAFQQRLGTTLSSFHLSEGLPFDYWQVQGAGGFGYPLSPSLRITYYVTELAATNGLDVNTTSFGPWLLDTFNSTLGCFEDLASSQLLDRCITTSMAVFLAEDLGILSQFNTSLIGDYLASCQDPITGGFFTEPSAPTPTLQTTRLTIEALQTIGQLSKVNTSAVIAFVENCQELDPVSTEYGGFYSTTSGGLVANLINAQDALAVLTQQGAQNSINVTALLAFLRNCEEPIGSGIFDSRLSMSSDEWVLGTANAIQILTHLDEMALFNTSNGRSFILANQFPNGGWGRGDKQHDFHNSPDETWHAVQGLVLTGGLGSSQDSLTIYLRDCCTGWGGATEPISFGDFLTSAQILSALNQVNALSAVNTTAFLDYLKYCWSSPQTSFTAHQHPPGVGVDTDTPTPDRMAIEVGTFGPLYHYTYASLSQILQLTGDPWSTRNLQIRQEIETSQTFEPGYVGMFGLHHLYIGRESDFTFRFDTTCWSLLAHEQLGGKPENLLNATSALGYLLSCLHGNGTHQYFHDAIHRIPLPEPWRVAEGFLAETWLGLQALVYLDPTCIGIDGQQIATYASQFLTNNTTLITAYYATEILYLLAEIGLYPSAPTLINQNYFKSFLVDRFTYQGIFHDSNLPSGKWLPYLVDLGLKFTNRLKILPLLDCNPILNLSYVNYPTGTLTVGEPVSFAATISELRWQIQLTDITVTANIFDTSYSNSCDPIHPGTWNLQQIIPVKATALGMQNLTLVAIAPGAIPSFLQYTEICEVWGNISLHARYLPGLEVPRSIPLNCSFQLFLAGSLGPESLLTNGNISITVEAYPIIFYPTHKGMGWYSCLILTDHLDAITHVLSINASVPYCLSAHTTDLLNITVPATITPNITLNVDPLEIDDALFSPVITIDVSLTFTNGTQTQGIAADLTFKLRAENSTLILSFGFVTDNLGFCHLEIETPSPGIYILRVEFSGQGQFRPCSKFTPLIVRTPSNPMSTLFSPLVLASLAFLSIGVILGCSVFILQRKRVLRIQDLFSPKHQRREQLTDPSSDGDSAG